MKEFTNKKVEELTDEQIKEIEQRVYNSLLKDFGRLYFENGRIPIGTYVAPLKDSERPVILKFLQNKGLCCSLAQNGLYYVKFPTPIISL